jgi:hypothetical protein
MVAHMDRECLTFCSEESDDGAVLTIARCVPPGLAWVVTFNYKL